MLRQGTCLPAGRSDKYILPFLLKNSLIVLIYFCNQKYVKILGGRKSFYKLSFSMSRQLYLVPFLPLRLLLVGRLEFL